MAKVGDKDIENIVFDKTRELLFKFGVKGWNMDDLSEACSMSKRTLYKIIGNKEDLLYKSTVDTININLNMIDSFLNSGKDYEYILENLAVAVINMFDETLIKNSTAINKEYPRIGDMIQNKIIQFRNLFQDFFTNGKKLGYFVDFFQPEVIYDFFSSIIEYNIINSNSKVEFETKMNLQIKIIIRGIRK